MSHIELGWVSGASGLCCLDWQAGLQLLDLDRRESIADILAWVDTWMPSGESGMIAVDAPTLIPNVMGMRLVVHGASPLGESPDPSLFWSLSCWLLSC